MINTRLKNKKPKIKIIVIGDAGYNPIKQFLKEIKRIFYTVCSILIQIN